MSSRKGSLLVLLASDNFVPKIKASQSGFLATFFVFFIPFGGILWLWFDDNVNRHWNVRKGIAKGTEWEKRKKKNQEHQPGPKPHNIFLFF